MRSKVIVTLLVTLLVSVSSVATALAPPRGSKVRPERVSTAGERRFVPDEVLVQFERGISSANKGAMHRAAGGRVVRSLLLPNTYVVRVPPGRAMQQALDTYRASELVRHATRNPLRYRLSHGTNDPLLPLWGLDKIEAPSAWHTTVGSASTVVAVIDDGVNWGHPDLDGNIFQNSGDPLSGGDDDGNGLANDFRGWDFSSMTGSSFGDNNPMGADTHGTHVAGTIGAEGNNGTGISGVAQDVSLLPIRIFNDAGAVPADATINAFVYAGMMGAKVANGSFGGPDLSAIEAAAIEAQKNTLFVFSAGNDANNNDGAVGAYPCNYAAEFGIDNAICVAATDENDLLADFSNYGANTVHMSAPGTAILSTSRHAFPLQEDFEGLAGGALPAGWSSGGTNNDWGTFALTTGVGFGSNKAATYPNSSNSHVDMPALDLSGGQSCAMEGFMSWVFATGDVQTLEASENGGPFQNVFTFTGTGPANPDDAFRTINVTNFISSSTVFRWHLVSNASGTDEGSIIDDLAVRCNSASGTDGGYQLLQGTSMAAPHVAGAAALIYADQPGANPFSVRRALIESGEVMPVDPAGHETISNRRLNAADLLLQDAVPPPVPSLSGSTLSQTFQKKTSMTLNMSAAGAAGYWLRLDRARYNSGNSFRSFTSVGPGGSKTLSLANGNTYCISANSVEPAQAPGITGNESNFTTTRCTSVPVNDTAMARSGAWTKKKATGTYMGDYSQTSKKGQTLSLSGVIFDKLALVATKCRGCGTVGLFFGSQTTPFKKVSLGSTTTKKLQVIQVFSRNDGPFISKITVKVLSSAKPVKIEGFGVFRR